MIASPQIYVYEAQLRASSHQQSDPNLSWIPAQKMDEGEVFHLYPKTPPIHMSGEACRAVIQFTEHLPESGQQCLQHIEALQKHTLAESPLASELFLFVDTTQKKPECKAFLIHQPLDPIPCHVHIIFEQSDLHTRHSGLLETTVLKSTSVGIIGVGSGGSTIAVELAKAGIGHFTLIDPDRLELGNISRHACGMGRAIGLKIIENKINDLKFNEF